MFSKNNLNNLKTNSLDWNLIQTELKNKLGNEVYESWLKKIHFLEEFSNYLLLSVPTRFIRDWITSRYLDQIIKIVKIYKKDIIRIEFKIVEQKSKNESLNNRNFNLVEDKENISFIKDTYLQYNRIDQNKRFENFVLGKSNKLAYEASLKTIENLSHYNPFYIYAGVGMGKKPQLFLKNGDKLNLRIDNLGEQNSKVVTI